MQTKTSYNKHGIFSDRKISVSQAMKILKNSGIGTNEEQIKSDPEFPLPVCKNRE